MCMRSSLRVALFVLLVGGVENYLVRSLVPNAAETESPDFLVVHTRSLPSVTALLEEPATLVDTQVPDVSSGGYKNRRRGSDPDDCFMCHDDESLTMERDGREILLYVNPQRYAQSPHRNQDCVDCHVGFDPDEEPHQDPIQPVRCESCHETASASFERGVHSKESSCATCHDNVHTAAGTSATERSCRGCHSPSFDEVAVSIHATATEGPTCLSCHPAHRFRRALTSTCESCHAEEAFVSAHPDSRSPEAVAAFEASIHSGAIECSDCHAGHTIYDTSHPESAVVTSRIATVCAQCHDEVAREYLASEHGKALATGFESAPTCTSCHGEHDIESITDNESPVSRRNEIRVCESCHLDSPEVLQRMTHTSGFVSAYDESIHGRAAAAGNEKAAVCSDCHGAHQAMKASASGSRTNKFEISATCGTCHNEIAAVFDESIHGDALSQGVLDAPTCTSCHSEHAIVEHARSDSPVAAANVSEQVCSPCHNSYKLSSKYGFASGRPESFSDSYHGLATRFGSAETANCASCHGVHDIWPSTDTRSRVHPANLTATCGDCHPGANENFARGSVHVVRTPEGNRLLYWISTAYIVLIAVVIGGMGAHNLLDWGRKLRRRYRETTTPTAAADERPRKTGLYLRMTVNERIQHGTLALSFILLVITGFMLKFPDAWWVEGLRSLMGVTLFELRGVLHRVAAVVMVGDSLYHIYYVGATARGRQFIRDIMLRGSDFSDVWKMLRYNLGLSEDKPQFDRFSYVEKAEYWALIWGTVIMTVTGFVLWFENFFMGNFSKLFVDVSEVIHYYEAWLAFLAIVVWHFYFVIFNPNVYPMNFTWLTGLVTEDEMEEEHPLELKRLKESERESDSGENR